MSHKIRVLYIDDSSLDRELVRDALTSDNDGFELTEAASRDEFESLLGASNYDVVVSDFNILGFEGLQVLEAVKDKAPDTPVVIVTGTGSEEVAVESMKRGAADYVIKSPSHIRRLPHTLKAVIDFKRSELARAQAVFERDLLFERSLDLLSVMGYDGNFKQLNPAWERTLGWTAEEMMAKPVLSWVHPEDRESAREASDVLGVGDLVISHESRWLCKDGDYRWIASSARPWGEGQLVFQVGRDITEQKLAQERIARQVARLRALHRIEVAISTSSTLEAVLSTLLDQAAQHLEVDAVSVLLCEGDDGALEFAAGKGFDADAIKQAVLRMSEGYAGSAVLERRIVHVPNIMEVGERSENAGTADVVSYYGAPLVARGEVKGALEVFHVGSVEPDSDWLDFLEMLAEQAAVAIDNAQLMQRLKECMAE